MRLGDVARLGEQQSHRLFGRGEDVGLGGVHDHHAQFGGLGEVDVVEADPGPSNDQQVLTGLEGRGVHLGGRANDQGVRAAHRFDEFLGREADLDVDLVTGVA